MASVGYALEDLRKQARHLENEIDLKLVSFSKLGSTKHDSSPDTAPLLGGPAGTFETMALEVEQLLAKLSEVNERMGAHQGAAAGSMTVLHALQRHRDILQDYLHEFQKTRANIRARRERDRLLGSVRRDVDAYKNSSGRRSEGYLEERERLRSSERMVRDQIDIAVRTKEELKGQRTTLKAVRTKMTTLANRFPVINGLVQRINLKKRRDSVVLGIVVGICVVLLLLYVTR